VTYTGQNHKFLSCMSEKPIIWVFSDVTMNWFGLNDAKETAKMMILLWDDKYFNLGRRQCRFRVTCTVQYSEVQSSTVQYSAVQCSTVKDESKLINKHTILPAKCRLLLWVSCHIYVLLVHNNNVSKTLQNAWTFGGDPTFISAKATRNFCLPVARNLALYTNDT
jgi:hypothetical protein